MTDENVGVAFCEAQIISTDAQYTGEALSLQNCLARRNQPEWIDERCQQISHLSELNDNWDSYGALAIDPRSIQISKQLLSLLSQVVGVEPPTITASPNGHVALCWDYNQRTLEIEIRSDAICEYAFIDEQNPVKDEEGETTNAERFAQLLTQW